MARGQSSPCKLPTPTACTSCGVSLCTVFGSPGERRHTSNDSESSQKGTGAEVQRPRSLLPHTGLSPSSCSNVTKAPSSRSPPQLGGKVLVLPVQDLSSLPTPPSRRALKSQTPSTWSVLEEETGVGVGQGWRPLSPTASCFLIFLLRVAGHRQTALRSSGTRQDQRGSAISLQIFSSPKAKCSSLASWGHAED